ncbi:MAG: trehalose-phosphatase [Desulfobacterota bacterium]|nr:trehalose-phosphatase [Thermodesulfobacteriota bacterium]
MKVLNPNLDLNQFFKRLPQAERKVLFLDYDGTLAPFKTNPGEALPYPGVREIISRIMGLSDTRLVIVTGRWTRDLVPLLGLERLPEIWGSHGLERLTADGSYQIFSMDERSVQGLADADELMEESGLSQRCEKKPGCLALHWRGLSEDAVLELKNAVVPTWRHLAQTTGLDLIEFDGGLELRVAARNKGDAVERVLDESLKKGLAAAYLGDDLTDEDAYKAIKGRGIGVLVRKEFRPTYADVWIRPPGELLKFLSRWLAEEGGRGW